jgi:uncharacterized protein (DUF427 family)|tara:strand:+ start:8231 stop:8515 length:285 start_codon:yes stop_codon:yes gene_type:complete
MPRALWNGHVIAETETFETVDGNIYFPKGSLTYENSEPSDQTSVCPWNGTANYYHVVVDDARNENAAWCYPDPKDAAANIKDHFAFWKGVTVQS